MQLRRCYFFKAFLSAAVLLFLAAAQGAYAAAPATFQRGKSSVRFKLDSALFDAGGRINDFSATFTPGPNGVSGGKLSARFNLNSIAFDPMPPEQLIVLKSMLALIRDPYVDFESSDLKMLDKTRLKVDGFGIYEHKKHPVSYIAQLKENNSQRTRLNGVLTADALSAPAVRSIEQFCGSFSGSATFELVFAK